LSRKDAEAAKESRFEILEHTADIGFRAHGRTVAELFETAAVALASIAFELENVEPRAEYPLAAGGGDYESLLVNWLSEVLYWIDGERVLFRRFRVDRITPERVEGAGLGEPRDRTRHDAKIIVKAVTYHQLCVAETPEGWQAEVYLDI
jgi:SHS2 domain-containing protein